jgi:hypothetical protein
LVTDESQTLDSSEWSIRLTMLGGLLHDNRCVVRPAQSFERRSETSDGLVAVALWTVGGLALTLLFIWLGSGAEFLSLG